MAEDDSGKQEEGEAQKTSPGPPESPEPVLSATTAIREDQVQNAIAFLSHPKVTNNCLALLERWSLISCQGKVHKYLPL